MSEERYLDALQEGLSEIPVPTASRDFDARVLAAVGARKPRWRDIFAAFRPAIGGAVVALPLMFWLIAFAQESTPARSTNVPLQSATQIVPDSALDSSTLTPLSFRRATRAPETLIRERQIPDRSGRRDSAAIVS